MDDWQSRTGLILPREQMNRLNNARVLVIGLGGVGSYAAEALCRAGVGRLAFMDGDVYSASNINRQLGATTSTVGRSKAEVTAARALDINPRANIQAIEAYYSADTAGGPDFSAFDYILDAVDTVTAKLLIIARAKAAGVPVISCMGTGNKLDPSLFRVGDISETSVCPLARVMRKELAVRGIVHVPVVWSPEAPAKPLGQVSETRGRDGRPVPGSLPFVPPVAGMLMAGHAILQLAGVNAP